jgi:uncharacterized protein (TIGR00299 family) protein
MAKTLYLDCISGLSGDMFLSGLIDLGLDPSALEHGLAGLKLREHVHLHAERQIRCGISGTYLHIHVHEHDHCDHDSHAGAPPQSHTHGHSHAHPPHEGHSPTHAHAHHHGPAEAHAHEAHDTAHGRSFTEIKNLIARSSLPDLVKSRAISVFRRIGVVEAAIHGTTIEEVHFHEVGAIDSIVDIVGACLGLHLLGIKTVLASPLVEGRGSIRCAHGTFPIPAPATLALLQGVPLTQIDVPHELITPTGAALLVEFAESFAPLKTFATKTIGYGLGTRDLPGRPNVVRMLLGEPVVAGAPAPTPMNTDGTATRVAVLTTNLDDITPEHLAYAMDSLLANGALDVALHGIQMKKGRSGQQLEVIARPEDQQRLSAFILQSTTAAGLRWRLEDRTVLERRESSATTPWGSVRVKILRLPGGGERRKAEFEDCRALAEKHGVTPAQIAAAAESDRD